MRKQLSLWTFQEGRWVQFSSGLRLASAQRASQVPTPSRCVSRTFAAGAMSLDAELAGAHPHYQLVRCLHPPCLHWTEPSKPLAFMCVLARHVSGPHPYRR